jgi:hypothetical protein
MFVLGTPTVGDHDLVRRTLAPMHNQGIQGGSSSLWDGNLQILGKGVVRTALWAVRSTGRWSGRGWSRGGAALDLLARRHNAPNSEIGTKRTISHVRCLVAIGGKVDKA